MCRRPTNPVLSGRAAKVGLDTKAAVRKYPPNKVSSASRAACPRGPGGAIITLVGLGHERRGYAGRLVYARGHRIQAGYGRLATTRIHMNHPMQIRLFSFCTLSRSSVQTAERWGL